MWSEAVAKAVYKRGGSSGESHLPGSIKTGVRIAEGMSAFDCVTTGTYNQEEYEEHDEMASGIE